MNHSNVQWIRREEVADAEPRQRSFLNADGLRVSYRLWGHGRPLLVCVHGLLRNGCDFDALAEELSDDYTVACIDLVGRGDSDWAADVGAYTVETYARDVRRLISMLGASRVSYLGTSLGGLVGMAVASAADSLVEKLILNDAAPEVPEEGLQALRHRMDEAPIHFPSLAEAQRYFREAYAGLGRLSDEQWAKFTFDSVRPEPSGWRMHYDPRLVETQAVPAGGLNLWELYHRIECPVLIMRGGDSPIVTPEVAGRMDRLPNTAVLEVPGCGHAPPLVEPWQIRPVRNFLAS